MGGANLGGSRLGGQTAGFSKNEANVGQRPASQRFGRCIRLNYGLLWDARTEQALQQLGGWCHRMQQGAG